MKKHPTFDEYQQACLRTADHSAAQSERVIIGTLGLVGEAGEFADELKKQIGHGHQSNEERMKSELGDVLFYVAELCNAYGWSMQEIADRQVAKSYVRYPEGFSTEASINRVDVERKNES